jgi:hypothetical protein
MPGRLKDEVCVVTGVEAALSNAKQTGGQMVSLHPADLRQQSQYDTLVKLAPGSRGEWQSQRISPGQPSCWLRMKVSL